MQFIQGLGLDEVLSELKRMHQAGAPTATLPADGELRASRKDLSVADMARSLLTGNYQGGNENEPAAPDGPGSGTRPPDRPGPTHLPATAEARPTDTSSISSSSAVLPGQSSASRKKAGSRTYWQSVAHIGAQIADALDYAHKQGVLHRDIKPSNLLLDTRGTVWVTDFGLAKTDDQQNLTHTGDILGTLRYMAPEAFEARSDARSDVYSLGLTLYELLALRPAFDERDRHRLIKKVTSEDPPRLDRLNSAIPQDLVTIVHKSVEKDPGHRYASAEELGADLQRFIDDEPILARPLSLPERGWRWCRHNPLVAGLTAALLLLLLSLTVASVVAAGYYDRLAKREARSAQDERDARLAADQARSQADEAHQRAVANLQEAERQRKRAEANFLKARAAVDDYLTRVSESQLIKVPGLQPLRQELLQSALRFYQEFLQEHGADPGLRAELAAAHLRVARINAELGRQADARVAFDLAIAEYRGALARQPGDRDLKAGLADCWRALGEAYFYRDAPQAERAYQTAVQLGEELVQTDPSSLRDKQELARCYNGLGVMQATLGNPGTALRSHQRSVELRQELILSRPQDPVLLHALGESLNNVAAILADHEHRPEALLMYERSLVYNRTAYTLMPHVLEYGLDLATGYSNLGGINDRLGRQAAALASYQDQVRHLSALADANPAVLLLQSQRFSAVCHLAAFQGRLGDTTQAAQTLRQAEPLLGKLPSGGAEDLFLLAAARVRYWDLGERYHLGWTADEELRRQRQLELAAGELRQAVAAGYRNVARMKREFALASLRERKEFQTALAQLEEKMRAEPVTTPSPDSRPITESARHTDSPGRDETLDGKGGKQEQVQADLALTYCGIAAVQFHRGDLAEGEKTLDRAVKLYEALGQAQPKSAEFRGALTSISVTRGALYWRAGRFAEGKRLWEQGLEELEGAWRQEPQDPRALSRLVDALDKVAAVHAAVGCWDEAARYGQRALDLASLPA
jgi:serine/threonine-protein kinase